MFSSFLSFFLWFFFLSFVFSSSSSIPFQHRVLTKYLVIKTLLLNFNNISRFYNCLPGTLSSCKGLWPAYYTIIIGAWWVVKFQYKISQNVVQRNVGFTNSNFIFGSRLFWSLFYDSPPSSRTNSHIHIFVFSRDKLMWTRERETLGGGREKIGTKFAIEMILCELWIC